MKLKLENIKIESFVTQLKQQGEKEVRGGVTHPTAAADCITNDRCTVESGPNPCFSGYC